MNVVVRMGVPLVEYKVVQHDMRLDQVFIRMLIAEGIEVVAGQ